MLQLLGIDATRALDANAERVVDRLLTALVGSWIRQALLDARRG